MTDAAHDAEPTTLTAALAREDYLESLRLESARFAEVLAEVTAETPVPSCPGWDVADLL